MNKSFSSSNNNGKRINGFTLIELLTVIAIIGILAAILIPVVGKVRENARGANCRSNLRQLHLSAYLYIEDHNGHFPNWQQWYFDSPRGFRDYFLGRPTVGQHDADMDTIATCPTMQHHFPSWSVVNNTYAMNYRASSHSNALPSIHAIAEPSQMAHFMHARYSSHGSGRYWYTSFVYHMSGSGSIMDTPFPHNGANHVVYFDGHVGNLTREEANQVRQSNSPNFHLFWMGRFFP